MRAAVVAPAVTEAEIRHRWDLATGAEERAEKSLAESRLAKGRILVDARKMFPARGPKAKGWGELLAKLKIDQQTAWKYMQLAGYVEEAGIAEEVSLQKREIPTYADAGIVKRAPTASLSEDAFERVRHERDRREVAELTASGYYDRAESAIQAARPAVVSESWAEDMESLAEQMIRSARQMFSAAEQLDALCRQRQAAISSAKFAAIPTHLLAAQASIASTLRIFKGETP